ncbi:MAG: NUDIX domain-containing protein [Patescibacteria group bacterium]|nr:NUDIX domain-containing protein [Patescibacteria group bacterium]
MVITASGILLQSKQGRILFLKRGDGSDYPLCWAFPGGRQEEGETLDACAIRETEEETGYVVEALGRPLMRSVTPGAPTPTPPEAGTLGAANPAMAVLDPSPANGGPLYAEPVDFTTYRVVSVDEFTPVLSDEHTAYAWCAPDGPPEPLHPGCALALKRLAGNERTVADMIAAGELVSPQRFENITLYAMRMSGTGVSYRSGLDEFVWRDPAVWISQEMIDRCSGVPVIFEHPKGSALNSDEFKDRVVGTVMFGYVRDSELWCVTRIYDDEVIGLLEEEKMSTSPAVVFAPEANKTLRLEDGEKLLVEGDPKLLDHLAICVQGVWDKGAEPVGIEQVDVKADSQETEMTTATDADDLGLDYRASAYKCAEAGEKAKQQKWSLAKLKEYAKRVGLDKTQTESLVGGFRSYGREDSDRMDALCDAAAEFSRRVDGLAARMDAWTPEQKAERDRKAMEAYNAKSPEEKRLGVLEAQLRQAKQRAANARGPQAMQSASASIEKLTKEISDLKQKIGK